MHRRWLLLAGLSLARACSDTGEHCTDWASKGECGTNPGYMKHFCKLSCKICENVDRERPLADVDKNRDGRISLAEVLRTFDSLCATVLACLHVG